jgi:hypothetical protein
VGDKTLIRWLSKEVKGEDYKLRLAKDRKALQIELADPKRLAELGLFLSKATNTTPRKDLPDWLYETLVLLGEAEPDPE